jgi:hypothetical protein
MIPILYAMIRARRTQALTMLFLAAIAAVAAISGPAYLTRVDVRVAARELRDADAVHRSIEFRSSVSPIASTDAATEAQLIAQTAKLPHFTNVSTTELPVAVPPTSAVGKSAAELMISRADLCDHVTMISGRCMLGVAEVTLPVRLATEFHLRSGDQIVLKTSVASPDGFSIVLSAPFYATVTGVYVPQEPADAYWGPSGYFAAGRTPPILTNDVTLAALPPSVETVKTLAIATPAAFAAGLSSLRSEVAHAVALAVASDIKTQTGIPDLITTIRANDAAAGRLIPVAAAPLVVMAWFVIFLAAAYSAAAIRFEYGVVALRGSPRGLRWWLASGENVLMILIGTLVSCLIVSLFAPVSIVWAAVSLLGSVVAALVAVVRPVSSSAAPLLRRVPSAVRGVGSRIGITAEILIVAGAAATAVQLRVSGQGLSGITLLVPGLIILGTATAASFAVIPAARRIGHRAVDRGRVATALAAFAIGRKPGAQRVLVLIGVAVGLLAFAAAGVSVGSTSRTDLAVTQTGATRIVDLAPASRTQILAAVDAADPKGAWAMAAVGLPAATLGIPPVLAVDANRLGAVAAWDPKYGPLSGARIGALLHPSTYAPPTTVTGVSLSIDYSAAGLTDMTEMLLVVNLTPLDGSDPVSVPAGDLANGRTTVTEPIPCAAGCRFDGFGVSQGRLNPYRFTLRFHSVRVGAAEIVGTSAGGGWSATNGATVTTTASGPSIAFDSPTSDLTRVRITPVPDPMPVVTTTRLPGTTSISLLDGAAVPVADVAVVAGLPRLGRDGTYVDLRFANLITSDDGAAVRPQVWLGPNAPADAIARLQAQGLIVASTTTPGLAAADLDQQGPAQALRFHLVAALLAMLLAIGALLLVAVVDRAPRAGELFAMRVQGVSARTVGRAASAGYMAIAAVASVIGLGSAALAWWVAGAYLPLFTASQSIWPASSWPGATAVAWPWLTGGAVLCAVALAAGVNLRQAVRGR